MSTHALLHLSLSHCIFPKQLPFPAQSATGRLHAACHLGRSDWKDNKRHMSLYLKVISWEMTQSSGLDCTHTAEGRVRVDGARCPLVSRAISSLGGRAGRRQILVLPRPWPGKQPLLTSSFATHPRPTPSASILGLCTAPAVPPQNGRSPAPLLRGHSNHRSHS